MSFKSALNAVWKGPFYIGPLKQPVGVGDAIMKFFEVAWRAGVLCAGAFIILVPAIAIISEMDRLERRAAYSASAPERERAYQLSRPIRDQVVASLAYGTQGCTDPARPLAITFTNNSPHDMRNYRWTIMVSRKGYSTHIPVSGDQGRSDLIIKPGASQTFCQQLPIVQAEIGMPSYPLSDLEYRLARYSVNDIYE